MLSQDLFLCYEVYGQSHVHMFCMEMCQAQCMSIRYHMDVHAGQIQCAPGECAASLSAILPILEVVFLPEILLYEILWYVSHAAEDVISSKEG